MDPHPPQGLILLPLAALIIYRLYRRFRSHIGPQKVQPRRMTLRVVILTVAAVALLVLQPAGAHARLEMLAAIALGTGLAWYSLHLTSFQYRDAERYYTPNLYIGLAVTTLFVLRLVYRIATVYPLMQQAGASAAGGAPMPSFPGALGGGPFSGTPQSALTLATFGLVLGYYAVYYVGVIVRSRSGGTPLPPLADKVN
jgi:hypothetical protein